jgi:hypothetical protein
MRARLGGDVLHRLWRAIHVIGDAETRDARQRKGELLAEQKLHQRQRRRRRWRRFAFAAHRKTSLLCRRAA